MSKAFTDFLKKIVPLSSEEETDIVRAIKVRTYPKGTLLLREREVSRCYYFVISGCIRQYYIVDEEEKTTFFHIENSFVISYDSYMKQTPALHYIDCLEDTTVAIIYKEAEEEMFHRYPNLLGLTRLILEEELSKYQDLLTSYIVNKPEMRYRKLLLSQPDLLNRVPQYYLASYLGVTAESLSRIRKRIIP